MLIESSFFVEMLSPEVCKIKLLSKTFHFAMIDALAAILKRLKQDETCKVVIFAAEDKEFFCKGYSLEDLEQLTLDQASFFSAKFNALFQQLEHLPQVTIAAVEGKAYGPGLELILACDLTFGTENSSYGFLQDKHSILPAMGCFMRLPKRCGLHQAKYLLLTGQVFSAQEALTYGIINQIQSSIQLHVVEIAHQIILFSQSYLQEAKKMLNDFSENPGEHFKIDAQVQSFREVFEKILKKTSSLIRSA